MGCGQKLSKILRTFKMPRHWHGVFLGRFGRKKHTLQLCASREDARASNLHSHAEQWERSQNRAEGLTQRRFPNRVCELKSIIDDRQLSMDSRCRRSLRKIVISQAEKPEAGLNFGLCFSCKPVRLFLVPPLRNISKTISGRKE